MLRTLLRPGRHPRVTRQEAVALVAGMLLASSVLLGCTRGDQVPGTAAPAGTPARVATTVLPSRFSARVSGEQEINPTFRQGVARADQGWVFSTNNGLFRTGEDLMVTVEMAPAIPSELGAQGYDHIGDVDIADGVLYVPIEREDKAEGRQVMARYDAATLRFIDSVPVAQHHNSFVTVDPATGTAYSTDWFDDDTMLRYDTRNQWKPLEPLHMSQKVGHIQGADISGGALWLATDDDHDGVYRVDLDSGAVQDIGSLGHVDGEGEGIDATELPTGLLHAVSIDAGLMPVRFVHLEVRTS